VGLPRACAGKKTTVTATTGFELIVLDTSGWLEYLTADDKLDLFAPYLEGNQTVLIPTVVLYEVRKALLLRQGKSAADAFYSEALKHVLISFDEVLAVLSAELSLRHKLSMADAIIYATAQLHKAKLVTSDAHFSDLPDVILH
jgi:predicted nucleic acid-binding protein